MLYSNEDIESKVYDPETGELVDLVNQPEGGDNNAELDERVRLAAEIDRMQNTEGWVEIKQWLETMEKNYRDQLLGADDFEKVRRLQEAAKTYRSVLNYIAHRVLEGTHLQELRDHDPQSNWG